MSRFKSVVTTWMFISDANERELERVVSPNYSLYSNPQLIFRFFATQEEKTKTPLHL